MNLDASKTDGNLQNIEDKYDRAYRTEWESGSLRDLIRLCYKTPHLRDNAIRYSQSEEFSAALSLLSNAGHPAEANVSVLDIGCGNGVACWSLAKAGYQVTGIDSSNGEWAGVGAARKLIHMDGVSFNAIHTLAEVLPFPPASFQVIWMREVLHHIKNLPEFLHTVRQLLVKDGILIAMRDHVIWNESQKDHFFRTHPFHKYTQDENCHYLNEYTEAFINTGWQLDLILDPLSTAINTFPKPYIPNKVFSISQAATGLGNSLYSFLARNPG
jgi:2-polyprenyl-3-methyl-5-hydroxy-6-metoxy-1,4-benzoquinol methylase